MSIHYEESKYPKRLLAVILTFFFVCFIIAFSIFAFKDVTKATGGGTVFISDGMTVLDTARVLKEKGIIKFPVVFSVVSRFNGYDTKIKTGKVAINAGMSYMDILEVLVSSGDVKDKIVISEGLEIKEIAQKFSHLVSEEEFYAALNKTYNYPFLENIPERELKLEGYLFPASYEFDEGVTAEEIINSMLKTFDEHFKHEYYTRAAEMGKTVDEIITLASIIERESASGDERAKVAGVFYNRLNGGMRLQSCATVQYILKERKPVLSKEDTKIDSPYNTYLREGLPVGPIANPGEESIKAALYPEETTAMYFVLGDDGKHVFSDTYEEHLKAKNGGN